MIDNLNEQIAMEGIKKEKVKINTTTRTMMTTIPVKQLVKQGTKPK